MAGTKKTEPKKGSKRLETANRDAKRKRDKRGGYKNLNRQYDEIIDDLSEPQQLAARLLFEFPNG